MKQYPTFRPLLWIDINTGEEKFGIQAKLSRSSPWRHMAEQGKACVYDTKKERDSKIKEFRTEIRKGDLSLREITAQIIYETK